MSSEADARRLVESIAADNGVYSADVVAKARDDPLVQSLLNSAENLKQIAANATQKLSKDLYSKDIHFVLECLQNADDNQYSADVEPFLRISVHPDRISFACNEVGFTGANVKALCSVGNSTKAKAATSSGQVRYIGAKGIGFKSVFKVAEKVFVRSSPFSFMFDSSKFLGMITPIWQERTPLSETADSPQTQILLLPPANRESYTNLFEDFKAIHPTILLFSRNLKKIEINIFERVGENVIPLTNIFSSKFSDDGNLVTLTARSNKSATKKDKYYLAKVFKDDMPFDERRAGFSRSEVILGFSVDSKGRPYERIESVHAFLPIREFGFKFLIQADFLLTSNRQDLEESAPWNLALRKQIPLAFCQAVLQFIKSQQHKALRYTWLRYLPTNITAAFWKPLQQKILKLMRSTHAIETPAGRLKLPSDLYFHNPIFWGQDSQLLVGDTEDFISSNYDEQDFPALTKLGVKAVTWEWFIDAFKNLPDHSLDSKEPRWHESVAKLLCEMPQALWATNKATLKGKKLIPLRDGTWIGVSEDPTGIFFQGDQDDDDIKFPEDITLNLVDTKASSSKHRKQLFKKLGVQNVNVYRVANLILAKHKDRENPRPSLAQSLAHVKYLYRAGFPALQGFEDMWLYDDFGMPSKGCNLYLDDWSAEFGAARLFRDSSKITVKFLHRKYTENMSEAEGRRFGGWLTSLTTISNTPRLLRSDRTFTPEFLSIMSQGSAIFLETLKQNWTQYAKLVQGDIKKFMSNQLVICASSDGSKQSCALKDCFAPDPNLCKISEEICAGAKMPFLDLPRPFHKAQWKFLANLGVGFEENLSFYLWHLKQPKFREICTLEVAKALYVHIAEALGSHDTEALLQEFTDGNGIFVPDKLWIKPAECVWDSPAGFSSIPSLKSYYADNPKIEMLFQSLSIRDATIDQVLADLPSRLQRGQLVSEEALEACKYLLNRMPGQLGYFDEERHQIASAIRNTFALNPLLPVPSNAESKTVTTAECLWRAPDSMHSKFVLKKPYSLDLEMEKFIREVLQIPDASTDDLLEELLFLKSLRLETNADINLLYEYWALHPPKILGQIKEIRQQFEEQALVLVPNEDGSFQWKKISECIWSATNVELQGKTSISTFYSKNAHLIHFFNEILNIKDAGLHDYLEELQNLQKQKIFDLERTKALYSKIQLTMGTSKTGPKLEIFETFPLILVPIQSDPQWVYPKDCVWTHPDIIISKTSLADTYGNFKRLFCSRLGIGDATPAMVVTQLVGLGREDRPIKPKTLKNVKDLLLGLSSFVKKLGDGHKLEDPIIELLRRERCWPCNNHSDGNAYFLSYTDAFFVADRVDLSTMFSNRVSTLAVAHEEILQIMDLLIYLGMQDKFLSQSITETTNVVGKTQENSRLTSDIRSRASELLSCVCHYNSNRSEEEIKNLQLMLSMITVRSATKIVKTYTLEGQGITFSSTDTEVILLKKEEPGLVVYISSSVDDQEFAWLLLPQKLCEFMNIDVEKAGLIIANVLNVKLGYMDKLLDPLGILGRVKSFATSSQDPDVDKKPQLDDVDRSDSHMRDVEQASVSRRSTHSSPAPTIYVDCEDPEKTTSKSQKLLESDDDDSIFIPEPLDYSTSNYAKLMAQQVSDEESTIEELLFDAFCGPPSPEANPRQTNTSSSANQYPWKSKEVEFVEVEEAEIPKKRKAAVLGDIHGPANKRPSNRFRGLVEAELETDQATHSDQTVPSD